MQCEKRRVRPCGQCEAQGIASGNNHLRVESAPSHGASTLCHDVVSGTWGVDQLKLRKHLVVLHLQGCTKRCHSRGKTFPGTICTSLVVLQAGRRLRWNAGILQAQWLEQGAQQKFKEHLQLRVSPRVLDTVEKPPTRNVSFTAVGAQTSTHRPMQP